MFMLNIAKMYNNVISMSQKNKTKSSNQVILNNVYWPILQFNLLFVKGNKRKVGFKVES